MRSAAKQSFISPSLSWFSHQDFGYRGLGERPVYKACEGDDTGRVCDGSERRRDTGVTRGRKTKVNLQRVVEYLVRIREVKGKRGRGTGSIG